MAGDNGPGIIKRIPALKKKSPIGIKIIVQQQTNPKTKETSANGILMSSQKQAANNAPVNLKPIHSINITNVSIIIKVIIFLLSFRHNNRSYNICYNACSCKTSSYRPYQSDNRWIPSEIFSDSSTYSTYFSVCFTSC